MVEGARDVPCLAVHPEQGAQRIVVGPAAAEGKAEARAAHDPTELVAGGVAVVGVRRQVVVGVPYFNVDQAAFLEV